ncbi:hypothetical protein FB645_000918 [Coemansia sp. IMI 203386]|nr:hypothetical protein FB645_000918 [Coemansia sp. IMI 203386]
MHSPAQVLPFHIVQRIAEVITYVQDGPHYLETEPELEPNITADNSAAMGKLQDLFDAKDSVEPLKAFLDKHGTLVGVYGVVLQFVTDMDMYDIPSSSRQKGISDFDQAKVEPAMMKYAKIFNLLLPNTRSITVANEGHILLNDYGNAARNHVLKWFSELIGPKLDMVTSVAVNSAEKFVVFTSNLTKIFMQGKNERVCFAKLILANRETLEYISIDHFDFCDVITHMLDPDINGDSLGQPIGYARHS